MSNTSSSRLQKKQASVSTSPSEAIFQWLSYAFWGWTAVATAALIATCTNFALNGYTSNYEAVAYVVATALVLLPIALLCDVLFSRLEQDGKSRIGNVIMVIHVVLYSLIAVAALATLVFSLVGMVISDSGDVNGQIVTAVTAATVVVFLGALVVRMTRPLTATPFRRIVRYSLSALVIGAMIWGIASPVAQTIMRKDDDRAKRAVELAPQYIDTYTNNNDALPETIEIAVADGQSYLSDADGKLVLSSAKDKLITYKPNVKPAKTEAPVISDVTSEIIEEGTTYYYELCVTFQYDDENRDNAGFTYYIRGPEDVSQRSPGSSTKAGTECYTLHAMSYGVKPL